MQDAIAVSLVQNNGGELLPSPKSRRNTGTDGDRELLIAADMNVEQARVGESLEEGRGVRPRVDHDEALVMVGLRSEAAPERGVEAGARSDCWAYDDNAWQHGHVRWWYTC